MLALQLENIERKKFDRLLTERQIHQYSHHQNFVLCDIVNLKFSKFTYILSISPTASKQHPDRLKTHTHEYFIGTRDLKSKIP